MASETVNLIGPHPLQSSLIDPTLYKKIPGFGDLNLGEQIQKIGQMLRNFCQYYAPIHNPQSEVEITIDEFVTDA